MDDNGLGNIYDVPSDLPNSGAVVGVHMIGEAWIEVSDSLDELTTEEKLLAESRSAYGDGAPPPLPEEQTNAQRYADRLAKLRQAVNLHERNVEALRKELAALR